MPIYEYRCDACGHELEALQKMADAPLVDCPACAAPSLRKQVSAAAFKLTGTGWYETDFKNSGKPAKQAGSSDSTSESGAASGGASGNNSGSSDSAAAPKPTKTGASE